MSQKRNQRLPYVKMPTDRELKAVYDQPQVDTRQINFRFKFETEAKIELLEQQIKADTAHEISIKDRDSEEYQEALSRKKATTQKINDLKTRLEAHIINFDDISIADTNRMIKNLEENIKKIDEDILNEDDETDHLETIMAKMKKTLDQLRLRDSEMRQESINDFVKQARFQRTKSVKRDQNKEFNIAKRDAEQRVFEILKLDHGEIASMFSTDIHFLDHTRGPVTPRKKTISWPHIIKGRQENVIPLSPGIPIPKRFDQRDKKLKDYIFTLSSFFNNPRFLKKMNEYYFPLGLEMTITQDKKFKNKWWIRLRVLGEIINFPGTQNYNDFVDNMNVADQIEEEAVW